MAHIVCQATANLQSDELEFLWSEGPASFEPYDLRGHPLKHFERAIVAARKALFKVVLLSRDGKDELLPDACLALARAGRDLYDALFPPKAGQYQDPDEIRAWLEGLRDQHLVESLEVLLAEKGTARTRSTPRAVPWNVLYDEQPDPHLFRAPGNGARPWQPFWGVRYNLAMGRKVDPRRRMPFWDRNLHVVFVVDPQVLPADEWSELQTFAERQAYPILHSRDELENYRAVHPVDLLYWLCHADPSALVLGGSKIDAVDLYRVCQRLFHRQSRGLVVLNACQTAEEGREGSFMEALHDAGLSGMVATEERTVNVFAHRFGLDFLQAFLIDGEAIGPALQKLRAGGHPLAPLGLLYGTYCPPDIRARRPTPASPASFPLPAAPTNAPPPEVFVGAFLGPQAESVPPPLPEHPYRSLAYYDREHRALFAGRDADVQRFALLLDEADSRILVLHGQSGVGKSSFLRAGLIPFLENDCIGYQFLRDRQEGRDEPILFIRATSDPAGPLAKALCDFCARREKYATPLASKALVEVDLPGILGRFMQGVPSPAALRDALRADTSLLGRLLAALAERLPYTLVLVIDQGEEVFTLARTRQDEANRHLALEMLRRVLEAAGRFRVIVSLRTEYYGRLLDALRQDVRSAAVVRDYLLTDLQEGELAEAMLRPTATAPIPHASEVPAAKYRFRYEPGVAETIAREVRDYCRGRQDSELPLAQIICTQLYERARPRPDAVISRQDFEQIGGVEGGLRQHVEALLADLLPDLTDQKAFKHLFSRLYRRQPDRIVTTELVLEGELERQWTGRMAFRQMLEHMSRSDRNLLRVKTLPGEQGERRYISLGHDALAQVAADWSEELTRKANQLKQARRLALAGAIIAIMATLVVVASIKMTAAQVSEKKATVALSQAKESKRAADVAVGKLERLAEQQAGLLRKAQAAEQETREAWYSADIFLAYLAWNDNNVSRTTELLEALRPRPGQTDLRQFEWYYLWRLCHNDLITLKGLNKFQLDSVAFSSDGKLLATGSYSGVTLWDLERKSEKQLAGIPNTNLVAFSPESKTLAIGCGDNTIRLWEVSNDRQKKRLKGIGRGYPKAISFDPNGNRLAAVSGFGIVVWELDTEKEIIFERRPIHRPSLQRSLAFSPNGKFLVTDDGRGGIEFWTVADGKKSSPYVPEEGQIHSLAFTGDGTTLASASDDGVVTLWSVIEERVKKLATLGPTHDPKSPSFVFNGDAVAFAPDSKTVATLGAGTARLWDLATRKLITTIRGHTSYITGIAFSPDGKVLATGSNDGTVKLWKVAAARNGYESLVLLKEEGSSFPSLGFSRDGTVLAAGGNKGTWLRSWSLATGKEGPMPDYAPFFGDGWALSADRKVKVLVKDRTVEVWDQIAHKRTHRFTSGDVPIIGQGEVLAVAISPDGTMVAAGWTYGDTKKQSVRLWRLSEGNAEELPALKEHEGSVTAIAFSCNGKRLLSTSVRGMKLWDLATYRELASIHSQMDSVSSCTFSPDGRTVAVAGWQWEEKKRMGFVRLFAAATEKDVFQFHKQLAEQNLADDQLQINLLLSYWGLFSFLKDTDPAAARRLLEEKKDFFDRLSTRALSPRVIRQNLEFEVQRELLNSLGSSDQRALPQ
jgi:WD40 repeat protein